MDWHGVRIALFDTYLASIHSTRKMNQKYAANALNMDAHRLA